MWPVITFFTNSTIHMVAHSMWAQVLMLAGAAELGVARGKLHSQYWRLTSALGARRLRRRAAPARAEPLVLRARGVPAPHARLDGARRRRVPARAGLPAALVHGRDGLRDDVRRDRGRCSTATATSRRSSATSRTTPGCRTGEAASLLAAARSRRSRSRPPRSRTRRCCNETPALEQRLAARADAVVLQFDQTGRRVPNGDRRPRRRRARTSPGRRGRSSRQRELVAPLPKSLPRGAYTDPLAGALERRARRLGHLDVRRPLSRARRSTDAVGAQGPTTTEHVVRWLYFLALALLVGGLGFRLLVVRGPLPPRAERRFYWVTGIGAVAALEVGHRRLPAPRRGRAPAAVHGASSTATSRRSRTGRSFGAAFIAMTLGFALVDGARSSSPG